MGNPVRKIKEGIPLKNPLKHEFGSVAWQDAMTHNILEKIKRGEELGPAERNFLEVQEMHIARLLTSTYYVESDLEKRRRIRRGYTKLRVVDARTLKERWEMDNDEALAWNPNRLESARERKIYDSYAYVFVHDDDKTIDIADGRHRIAAAAEKGRKIKVAFHESVPDKLIGELE